MKIIKNELSCFYCITKFSNHQYFKNSTLKLIDIAKYHNPQNEACEVNITKTDWHDSRNMSREWLSIIYPKIKQTIHQMFCSLNFEGVDVEEIWFQQYLQNSEHGWHTHGCNFTGVYYLEFPKDCPKTLILEPYTNKEIELDVTEGDIVIFPSFTIHKAPKNMSDKRKTIISFNLNVKLNYDQKYFNLTK